MAILCPDSHELNKVWNNNENDFCQGYAHVLQQNVLKLSYLVKIEIKDFKNDKII